ncbi:MAG: GNAT family protein [Pseudolabrys sp.]|nr:GNAT family protein [Pseudolabrys sp.]
MPDFELHSEPLPETGQPVSFKVDMMPSPAPEPVTIKGRYGSIEKLEPRHTDDLWKVFEGYPEVWTYIGADGPFSDKKAFAAQIEKRAAATDPYAYAIIDANGHAVGYFTLMSIVPAMRSIEVGHVLYSPALMRTQLGTEAQYLLMRYAFETLNSRRYEWKCNALNAPSRSAALRYGFTFEGILRQVLMAKGRNRDTAYYSIIDSEWPARKAVFERWLSPDNFGTDGKQKVSLRALNGTAE